MSVYGSGIVKAGEHTTFSVTLDQPPSFEGGRIYAEFQVDDKPVFSIAESVNPQDRTYSFPILIPIDSPAATWVLKKLVFAAGSHIERPIAMRRTISFQVIPASDLRYPTSADVTINLSQTQLLRTEAAKLQRQVQELKAMLASSPRGDADTLGNAVRDALAALDSTERSFRQLTTSSGKDAGATGVFFDDLRLSYRDAQSTLRGEAAARKAAGGRLILAAQKTDYPPAAYAVLRSFEQNELAYTVVADAQSLVINLDVRSVPAGATVCYHRRNDPCHPHPDQTNSTIPALPYAIWVVHFEKPGYRPEDREHDPFRESNHVVVVELKK